MPKDQLGNDRWVVLEEDIRTALSDYGIEDQVWLVHDLLTAFRLCLTASRLVKWETARKYYQTFPERLDRDESPTHPPFDLPSDPNGSPS